MYDGLYAKGDCGHSVDLDHYGCEGEEEYENLYPTLEEVIESDK